MIEDDDYLDEFIAANEVLTKITTSVQYEAIISEQTSDRVPQRTMYFFLRDKHNSEQHVLRRFIAPFFRPLNPLNPYEPRVYEETLLRNRASAIENYIEENLNRAVFEAAKNVMIEAFHLHSRREEQNAEKEMER